MTPTTAAPALTVEQLQARIAELEAAAAKKKAAPPITMKVGKKGGISIYGFGRYPLNMYKSTALKVIELVESGKLLAFITENESKLASKEGVDATTA